MTTPRPGWYPDPAGTEDLFRFWDGQEWTEAISESRQAPPPRAVPPPSAASPASTDSSSCGRLDPGPRHTGVAVVAFTIGVALFVTAGLCLGAGLVWQQSKAKTLSRPSTSTPAAGPAGQVDEATGRARIGRVEMQLPGEPYQVYAGSVPVEGAFDIFFVSNAVVHRNFAAHQDWSATVGLAHLTGSAVKKQGLTGAGESTLRTITQHFFGGHPTTVTTPTVSSGQVSGHPSVIVRAEVHYAISKLASSHDVVTVVLVQLNDGSLVAAISSIPDDAEPAVRRQAAAALATLQIS
ncbi:hypothetical protein GCM10009841_15800 [Microlunatus panaciterrae]|uniref:DUF2510 domain-containing protein n=1 Tax=Microlunatus panaciterrae TaxID=400768 RepID=A0ABS2RN54_9ACTN|nr:hypothetical protein [Microlunatus panaciterrae]